MKFVQLVAAAALFCAAASAHALELKPYSAAALAQAQMAGKPVALHFRADWCPTCRAQDKLLDAMKSEPGLDLTVLAVDYDTEKELKKQFAIRSQSTLVVLRGQKETSRSINDTTAAGLRTALKTALWLVASEGGAVRGGVVLALFGLGAAIPLVAVAYASRSGFVRARDWVQARIEGVRRGFAVLLGGMGVAILSGADKWAEARVLGWLPDAWVNLTVGI